MSGGLDNLKLPLIKYIKHTPCSLLIITNSNNPKLIGHTNSVFGRNKLDLSRPV